MDTWRKVWRESIAPQLSMRALRALQQALLTDDPRLVQGTTTTPPPVQRMFNCPVEAACAIGYCGWQGEMLGTVGEVEEFFAKVRFNGDQAIEGCIGCQLFIDWFDETPREEMRLELLPEVELELHRRNEANS